MYGIEVKRGSFRATLTQNGSTASVGVWRSTYEAAARDIEAVGGARPDPSNAIAKLRAMIKRNRGE